MSVSDINDVVAEKMQYDEYKYQADNNIRISYEERAKGLHLPLYQCPVCKKEFSMVSEGIELSCSNCMAKWEMDELGKLVKVTDGATHLDFSHIPDWYEWERKQVVKQIDAGTYHLDCRVKIEALPNAVNFINCGEGWLRHEKEGFNATKIQFATEYLYKYVK